MLPDQGKRPLLHSKRGAFLYADLGPLGMAPEGGEHRHVGIDPQRIIAPMAGRDHPAIEVEDAHQFLPVERGDRAPVPGWRERRDDTQALLTFGCGWRRSPERLHFLAQRRDLFFELAELRARTGSTSSPHGVP